MQKDYPEMDYHPLMEKLTKALKRKVPSAPRHMLRSILAYYFSVVASTMRVNIETEVRGVIPVNLFLFNMAPSGTGKNHSVNIIEKEIIGKFKNTFLSQVLPIIADETMANLAVIRANAANEDPDAVKPGIVKEYIDAGQMRFSFKRATQAALQQMRQKLLLAGAGSMNLQIDELGMNLLAASEAFAAYLEFYDIGECKEILTKNTKENTRVEELEGATPANMLCFGSPSKIYDSGKVEEAFKELLETGYARRSFFSFCTSTATEEILSGEELYDLQASKDLETVFEDANIHFGQLANVANFNRTIILTRDVGIELFNYMQDCKKRSQPFIETQEMVRAEMEHRYFKVLKLAGVYAFIDGAPTISMDNLYAAIRYAEDSGKAFWNMTHQEPVFAKIARYIAATPHELTQADLSEELPYYKGTAVAKRDLMTHATAWGYRNHIVIKEYLRDGIQFFSGTTLKETDLSKLILSHSAQITEGYVNDAAPFDKLHILTQMPNYNWINHGVANGYRDEDHVISGFNLVVLDIDGGTKLDMVHTVLKDYKFMTYTTKRHTPENHRFRLIMPLNYEMSMSADEYRLFMKNIYEWLPFSVDTGAIDRCRKWLTNAAGTYRYSKGTKLLDARIFIPKTKKNDERKKVMLTYSSLSNLERWFVQNTPDGNRNNQLLKYAMVLVDLGYQSEEVRARVMGLNDNLPDKLPQDEIDRTIMVTANKAIATRAAKMAAA